ncbi:hypothetical protein HN51_058506 [Arachis hypogaea]
MSLLSQGRRDASVAVAVERSRRSCLSPPKEEPLPPSIVTGKHTVPPCLWSPESRTGEKGAATPVAAASYFYSAFCNWCVTWKGDKLCSGCRQVWYCSEKHQVKSNWMRMKEII